MIYVFENENGNACWVENDNLPDIYKQRAIMLEQLPPKEQIEGKQAILKCKKATGEVWYEYVDIPPTSEDLQAKKIAELETALLEMTTLNAIQQQRIEQAIMELTMMIGGM